MKAALKLCQPQTLHNATSAHRALPTDSVCGMGSILSELLREKDIVFHKLTGWSFSFVLGKYTQSPPAQRASSSSDPRSLWVCNLSLPVI